MNVIVCTDENFETEALHASTPVLVDFWAPWCGPCKALGPAVEEIADACAGRLKVVKVDVAEGPRTAARFGVTSIPDVLIFHGGEVKARLPGVRSKQALREAVGSYID